MSRSDSKDTLGLVAAIKGCGNLEWGKQLHQKAVAGKLHKNKYVSAALIKMYSKFGVIELAQEVFNSLKRKDTVTWTCLILGYVENGKCRQALKLYWKMDCDPDSLTFVAVLKAYATMAHEDQDERQLCLREGAVIHRLVQEHGFHTDIVLATTLVDMYCKCGSMGLAKDVFDGMPRKNVVTWTSLIHGYIENGESSVAMELFFRMNCKPNTFTYVAALKACKSMPDGCLWRGMGVHKRAQDDGFDSNILVATTLVDMYCKLGSLQHAKQVFDSMTHRNVVTWNALILGYAENGESVMALELIRAMDCKPNFVTYAAALKVYGSLSCGNAAQRQSCLEKGAAIHKEVEILGLDSAQPVAMALLDMYTKCGSMVLARRVFHQMLESNVAAWTTLILGYVENGEIVIALDLFECMDCKPDSRTYVAVLKACASLASEKVSMKLFCLGKGMNIHKQVKKIGLDKDMAVATALVDMYSKCGSMAHAVGTFNIMSWRDSVTWTALILGYVENGTSIAAVELVACMDCLPDPVTYIAILKAYGSLASKEEMYKLFCLEKGITIHKQLKNQGFQSALPMATTVLDMYRKCGSMDHAKEVFDDMTEHNSVAWNSLLLGYVECGDSFLALKLFNSMDCEMDCLTYIVALKAASVLASLSAGHDIHVRICKLGLEQEQTVVNCLIYFYIRCGCVGKAYQLFENVQSPDAVSWNTLIAGYSYLGDTRRVFCMIKEMNEAGVELDGITLTSILTACSHAGLLEESKHYLEFLGIGLCVEHYNCVIDALSRANKWEEALVQANNMPFKPNNVTWTTLLGASMK